MPAREFPAQPTGEVRIAPALSARFEPVYLSRDVTMLSSHVLLSVTLAEPAASDTCADTSLRCQGLIPPQPGTSRLGCPQLHRPCCYRPGGEGLSRVLESFSASPRTRVQIPPTTSVTLATSSGSVENSNVSARHGWTR